MGNSTDGKMHNPFGRSLQSFSDFNMLDIPRNLNFGQLDSNELPVLPKRRKQ